MRLFATSLGRFSAFVLRMLLGLFFIVSAVAKWVDIDRFEIYVFSYQWLSLKASFLVARLIVVAEILVGIGLLSNLYNRWVNACAVLMLTGFSMLLGYAALSGRTDSCQCMGALAELNPTLSLLKNAVLLLLMVPASSCQPWPWHPRWYLWPPVLLSPLLFVFITSAPDNWMFHPDTLSQHDESWPFLSDDALAPLDLAEGRHAVLFLTPECRYCRLADQKMDAIRHRHRLDSTLLHYVVPTKPYERTSPGANMDSVAPFSMPVTMLPDSTFRVITHGMRPLLFLLDNGRVVAISHYRNMDEEQISQFLSQGAGTL